MKKNENGEAVGELGSAINDQFGGYGAFREKFTSIANSIFGSGWTWLVRDSSGKLSIIGTANQDSPLSLGFVPLVALDEWEHAYYLSYQNRRQEYVDAFWNVINWEEANRRFASK
jgi:Fe-Mn family superoxide dismutase